MMFTSEIDTKIADKAFRRLGLNERGQVQIFAANEAARRMDKYVPFQMGNTVHLRTNIDIQPDYIEYDVPYAHYIYEGELYVDPETGSAWAKAGATKIPTGIDLNYHEPGTGAHWDKLMMSAEGKDYIKDIRNKVKELDNNGQ